MSGAGAYRYRGAETLVALQERHLRDFLDAWRRFGAGNFRLPRTADPNYADEEVLLAHVLGCSARYLGWICEQRGRSRPELDERPEPAGLSERADTYLEEILEAWDRELRDLTEKEAYAPARPSTWGPAYCLDAMIEHAAMHPLRHTFQLESLMREVLA